MGLHRTLSVMAFLPPLVNPAEGIVTLRLRTTHGDVLALSFTGQLAAHFGRALLCEGAVRDPASTRKLGRLPGPAIKSEGVATSISNLDALRARREQHLAAARTYLQLPEPRGTREAYAAIHGLSYGLFNSACNHEIAHPGQPWDFKRIGRRDQILPEQRAIIQGHLAEVRAGRMQIKELAAKASVSPSTIHYALRASAGE